MRTARGSAKLSVLILTLAVGAGAYGVYRYTSKPSGGSSGDPLAPLSALPADALAVASIADVDAWRAGFAGTEVGQLLRDPEIALKLAAAMATADPEERAQAGAVLEGLQDAGDVGVRSLAMAVFPVGEDQMGLGIAVAADDPAAAAAWLDQRLEIEDGGERACKGVTCREITAAGLAIGSPEAALERMLASDARLVPGDRIRSAAEEVEARADGMFLHLDLAQLMPRLLAAADSATVDPATIAQLGLDALDDLAYADHADGASYRSRSRVRHREPLPGVLGVLLATPSGEATFDRLVPAGSSFALFGHLDDPARTWDRLLEEIRKGLEPEQIEQLDQGIALTGLLGIDIREDLFAALGGEMALAYTMSEAVLEAEDVGAALAGVEWSLVVGVVDPPRLDKLLAGLDGMGMVSGSEPLGDGVMRSIGVPVPDAPPLAIALASGKLVIASSPAGCRAAIDGDLTTLADEERFADVRTQLPDTAGWWSYSTALPVKLEQLVEMARSQMDEARQRQTQAYEEISVIAGAVDAYATEHGAAPGGHTTADLSAVLVPDHAQDIPVVDPWGNPYGYAARDDGYAVWSTGADGAADEDWTACAGGCPQHVAPTESASADVVAAGGAFVRWPEGGEAPAELDPAMRSLLAELDQRLAGLTPSMAVFRDQDGAMVYDAITPVPLGLAGFAGGLGPLLAPRQ